MALGAGWLHEGFVHLCSYAQFHKSDQWWGKNGGQRQMRDFAHVARWVGERWLKEQWGELSRMHLQSWSQPKRQGSETAVWDHTRGRVKMGSNNWQIIGRAYITPCFLSSNASITVSVSRGTQKPRSKTAHNLPVEAFKRPCFLLATWRPDWQASENFPVSS